MGMFRSIIAPLTRSRVTRLVFLLLFLVPFCTSAATLQGTVVGVTDGDTITVLDASKVQHKIRLSGIDAPEKRQPFGNTAKESLSAMVYKRQVDVEYRKKDRNGRTVGKVMVNGVDANLAQVRAGLAWHYKAYQKEQPPEDRLAYSRAEETARRAEMGLWRDGQAVPPWQWRRSLRVNVPN